MTLNSHFEDANDKLEKNDFHLARELFREASQISEPSHGQLANLAIAEREEVVQFRRQLCSLYPSSTVCKLELILILRSSQRPALAVLAATESLSEMHVGENERTILRLVRFRSALEAKDATFLVEDFSAVWHAGDSHKGAIGLRNSLLTAIASSKALIFADVFDELSQNSCIGKQVAMFLRLKASELRALNRAMTAHRQMFVHGMNRKHDDENGSEFDDL